MKCTNGEVPVYTSVKGIKENSNITITYGQCMKISRLREEIKELLS